MHPRTADTRKAVHSEASEGNVNAWGSTQFKL